MKNFLYSVNIPENTAAIKLTDDIVAQFFKNVNI